MTYIFSVVIPLFNKAHIIERTIQSVLNQTFTNFEVIIVNDGSTDDGVKVINRITDDSRIRIITQKNQGVSVARNRGVKESQFEYIAFIDGDDEWEPDFLLKIKEAIEKYPDASMYGTSSLHTDFITKDSYDSTISEFRNKIVKVDCFKIPNALPHTSAIVVKKSSLYKLDKELNVFPIGMKVCEDWACFHRLALSDNLIYIGIPLGIRNNNVEGQITGNKEVLEEQLFERWLDGVSYYNIIFNYWLNNNLNNKNFISFIRYNLRHNIKWFLINNNWEIIEMITQNLAEGILSSNEIKLYKNKLKKPLSIHYINIKKLSSKISKLFKT